MGISIIGEKLKEAQRKKNEERELAKNDMNNWFWKGPKKVVAGIRMQSKEKLLDASLEQLKTWYNHCYEMLWNKSATNPGRYVLKDIVDDQILNCGTELLIRLQENRYKPSDREALPRTLFYKDLTTLLSSPDTKDSIDTNNWDKIPIRACIANCPEEFRDINARKVLDGCLGNLGKFSRKHITLTFILNMGINLTEEELSLFKTEAPNIMEAVKNKLGIPDNFKIKRKSNGLTYKELQSIIHIKEIDYTSMSNEVLLLLRDKMLPRLLDEIYKQIYMWEDLLDKLNKVAIKNFDTTLDDGTTSGQNRKTEEVSKELD